MPDIDTGDLDHIKDLVKLRLKRVGAGLGQVFIECNRRSRTLSDRPFLLFANHI